jgi:hypothetical protein
MKKTTIQFLGECGPVENLLGCIISCGSNLEAKQMNENVYIVPTRFAVKNENSVGQSKLEQVKNFLIPPQSTDS